MHLKGYNMKLVRIFLLFFSITGFSIRADQNKIKDMTYKELTEFFPKYEKYMRKEFEKTEEFLAHIRSWRAFSDRFLVIYVLGLTCWLAWAIYNKKKNDKKIQPENVQKIG
jgi:hypothetical protein